MQQIKQHIINAGAKCSFCRPKKVPVVWKAEGFLDHKNIACNEHRDMIKDEPFELRQKHLTEADYQTWMRL